MPTYDEAKTIFDKLITHFELEKKATRNYTDTYHDTNTMKNIG
jgi:hypothetical protein